MIECQNCGQEVEKKDMICPNCGEYIKGDENFTQNNIPPEESAPEDILRGPAKDSKNKEDFPEENYPEDELNKQQRDERSDFGRSD